MGRILLTWEMGGGTGHLHKLAAVLPALQRLGHKVVVASRDVTKVRSVFGFWDVEVLPAPYWIGLGFSKQPAGSYSELLFRVGYLRVEDLRGLVEAWRGLIRIARIDLLIAEHSPTAILAARTLGIPYLVLGSGFFIPPKGSPPSSLRPWNPPDRHRLLEAERLAVGNINELLSMHNAESVRAVADLFYEQEPMLMTLPELDHYGVRESIRYWGSFRSRGASLASAEWPGRRGEKVFVYLHPGYRQFPRLVKQLGRLTYRSLVVAPGISEPAARKLSTPHMRVTSRPVDLVGVAKACRVIINHAAHGTMAQVLLLGRPVLMLPNYVEQTMLAWRVAQQQLGIMVSPDPDTLGHHGMIERMLDSPELQARAAAFATRYRERPLRQEDFVEHVVTLLEAQLPTRAG